MEERAKYAIRPLPKKIRHHVMSITYPDKIDAVQDGRCCQTIRKGRKVSIGDEINFVGYDGKAWRKWVTVTKIINIYISDIGISQPCRGCIEWNKMWVNYLARLDFINPPTGEALRDVLFGLNGAPDEPQEYQIIRWKVI